MTDTEIEKVFVLKFRLRNNALITKRIYGLMMMKSHFIL